MSAWSYAVIVPKKVQTNLDTIKLLACLLGKIIATARQHVKSDFKGSEFEDKTLE